MEQERVADYWEGNAETRTRHSRAGRDVYRDALNTPAFLVLLPPVYGLTGLDIGCGEGSNTRQVVRRGARMSAIDISPTFIRPAQATEAAEPLGIVYATGDGMRLPFEDGSFDFATAFMCLMDMPDQPAVLGEAARVLRPGGFLQFSILHPCFVPPHRKVLRDADGRPRAIEVAGLLRSHRRTDRHLLVRERAAGGTRDGRAFPDSPLPLHVERMGRHGLRRRPRNREIREPSASEEVAAAESEVADTRIVPLSLIVRARKSDR